MKIRKHNMKKRKPVKYRSKLVNRPDRHSNPTKRWKPIRK